MVETTLEQRLDKFPVMGDTNPGELTTPPRVLFEAAESALRFAEASFTPPVVTSVSQGRQRDGVQRGRFEIRVDGRSITWATTGMAILEGKPIEAAADGIPAGSYDVYLDITDEAVGPIRECEQQHVRDFEVALSLSAQALADAINGLRGELFEGAPEAAQTAALARLAQTVPRHLVPKHPEDPAAWWPRARAVYTDLCDSSKVRDRRGHHRAVKWIAVRLEPGLQAALTLPGQPPTAPAPRLLLTPVMEVQGPTSQDLISVDRIAVESAPGPVLAQPQPEAPADPGSDLDFDPGFDLESWVVLTRDYRHEDSGATLPQGAVGFCNLCEPLDKPPIFGFAFKWTERERLKTFDYGFPADIVSAIRVLEGKPSIPELGRADTSDEPDDDEPDGGSGSRTPSDSGSEGGWESDDDPFHERGAASEAQPEDDEPYEQHLETAPANAPVDDLDASISELRRLAGEEEEDPFAAVMALINGSVGGIAGDAAGATPENEAEQDFADVVEGDLTAH